METLAYTMLVINFLLVIFIVFMIERLVMIMKAGSLTELMKFHEARRKNFKQPNPEEDDFI